MGQLAVMKQFLPYLFKYRLSILMLVVAALLSALAMVPLPFLYSTLVDNVLPNKNINQLGVMIGLVIVCFIVSSGMRFIMTWFGVAVSKRFKSEFRLLMVSDIQKLPIQMISKIRSLNVDARLSRDLDELIILTPDGMAILLNDGVIIVGMIAVLSFINWELMLISALVFLMVLGIVSKMMKGLSHLALDHQETRHRLQVVLHQLYEGMLDINLTNSKKYFHEKVRLYVNKTDGAHLKLRRHEAVMMVAFSMIPMIGSGLLWGIGGWWTISNLMTLGEIIAFSYAFNYLFQPVSNIMSFCSNIVVEIAALNRIFSISLLKQANIEGSITMPKLIGRIQLENISFGYNKNEKILDNICITFEPCTLTCIFGKNGGGKSSLFKLLLMVEFPFSGGVLIDGVFVNKYKRQWLVEHIGYVPQDVVLFDGSIKDNILMGRHIDVDWLIQCCDRVGICGEEIHSWLNNVVEDSGKNLSGGQRQKVALIRALVSKPTILLMDEPTNHLDDQGIGCLSQCLALIKSNTTIVIVTHQPDVFSGVDNIFELVNKQLIKQKIGG